MSFQLLARKINLVQSRLKPWQLQALEREFVNITKMHSLFNHSSTASRGYLFIELGYAMVRHVDWFDVQVFQALAIEFLQLDHRLPRLVAQQLVEQFTSVLTRMNVATPRTLCIDDREFLTYAYILAATSTNDQNLEMELGLGSALLKKLRDGVQLLDGDKKDFFIPEYDAMLAEIILEMKHQLKARSWAVDEQRLKFKLLENLGDQAVPWILEEHLSTTLQQLMSIGCEDKAEALSENLIKAFEKSQLIIADKDGRGRVRGWELTEEGSQLTSGIFNALEGEATINDMQSFLAVNKTWQIGLIETIAALGFITDILANHLARLAPSVLEASVARVVKAAERQLDAETIQTMLNASKLPWHKAAILRALSDVEPSSEIADVIAQHVTQDPSQSMIEAAGALVQQWDMHT